MAFNPEIVVVPTELQPFLERENVQEALEPWQTRSADEVFESMVTPEVIDLGNRRVRAAVIRPEGEADDTALVLSLPFQQGWKPSMDIRARVLRDVVAPNSTMIVFPQNSRESQARYYELNKDELEKVAGGVLRPVAELQLRTLEKLGIGKAALTGYSLGALLSLNMAATGSDKIEITRVNADEAPSKIGRSAKELNQDFRKSGGPFAQRKSMKDSGLPSIMDVLSVPRMVEDYANFGLSLGIAENKALSQGMAGGIESLVVGARQQNPDTRIKLGYVAGSKLFDVDSISKAMLFDRSPEAKLHAYKYSGEGTHMHTTGDNPVAHALMALEHFEDLS